MKSNCNYIRQNVQENNNLVLSTIVQVLDSGCTDHIINDDSYFYDCKKLEKPIDITVADGRILKCKKVGNIITYFIVKNVKTEITISNVFYLENMDRNFLSLTKIANNKNYKVLSHGNASEIFNKFDQTIGTAFKENGL